MSVRVWWLAVVMVGVLSGAAHATGPKVEGVELPAWSKEIGDHRYNSSRDWEGTIRHFRKGFAGWKYIKWHREVNLPGVKYIHIENTYPKRTFDGLNIYELPGGHVRIYVLKHEEPAAEKEADEKKTDGKTGKKTS